MWPRFGSSKLISTWITATIVLSVFAFIDGGTLARWLALQPARVWHGEVWRLVTWIFVEVDPLSLVITCASIYKFGGELAPRWGDRRMQRYVLEIILGTAIVTCIFALAVPSAWHMWRLGGWCVGDMLVIAWARQYPFAILRVYGMLQLSGQKLIQLTLGVNFLFLLAGGVRFAPEILVCLAAAYYPTDWLDRR